MGTPWGLMLYPKDPMDSCGIPIGIITPWGDKNRENPTVNFCKGILEWHGQYAADGKLTRLPNATFSQLLA